MGSIAALATPRIVVLGAGVIGLTTALSLARRGYIVKIVARDHPEDFESQGFASPWAGANWCPFSTDRRICDWETEGYARLAELIPSGIAMRLPVTRYAQSEEKLLNHWYKDVVPDYKHLPSGSHPSDPNAVAISYTSLSVNAPKYCQWLAGQANALGVEFERREVTCCRELLVGKGGERWDIVVNATGLGARHLTDVLDTNVEPIRGQTVLVHAPAVKQCMMDSSEGLADRSTYMIPRPGGTGGEVILGGCYQMGSYDTAVDDDLAQSILSKCLALDPRLATLNSDTSDMPSTANIHILRHNVGLRPSRTTGPRLEADPDGLVVHAYGIGPAGYQASWGMAKDVCDIVGGLVVAKREARMLAVVMKQVAI